MPQKKKTRKSSLPCRTPLPADERYIEHWNHDPWALEQGGKGRTLGDGGVFLLPYYMGVYYKFIGE